jgi:two-component system, NarL family, nitrate/nitrite response regulator NarL
MKIVIIDSNYLLREGLKKVLSLEKSMELIGEGCSVKEAISVIRSMKPELVIIELRLGKENGFKIVEEIKKIGIECRFIVLTSSSECSNLKRVEELGIDGYLLKDALPEEILHAIKTVAAGRKYYDTNLILNLINTTRKDCRKNDSAQNLTKRETEVLIALGKGLSNGEIADRLQITEFTVKKHVSQVLLKLNIEDRTQAALYANLHGLVDQLR